MVSIETMSMLSRAHAGRLSFRESPCTHTWEANPMASNGEATEFPLVCAHGLSLKESLPACAREDATGKQRDSNVRDTPSYDAFKPFFGISGPKRFDPTLILIIFLGKPVEKWLTGPKNSPKISESNGIQLAQHANPDVQLCPRRKSKIVPTGS